MNIFLKSFLLVGSLLSTIIVQGMLPENDQVRECQPQERLVNDLNRYILYLYLNETLNYNFSSHKQIPSINNLCFTRAAINPDGKTILIGSQDGTAYSGPHCQD